MRPWPAAVAVAALAFAGPAAAARPVTHAEYQALLKQANTKVTRAQAPIQAALAGGAFTTASLRHLILALASANAALGRQFAALAPPEPAARKANVLFAKAERDLGAQTKAMAGHLPKAPTALAKYLAAQNPPGGLELDKAIAELTADGYRTRF